MNIDANAVGAFIVDCPDVAANSGGRCLLLNGTLRAGPGVCILANLP